MRTDLGDVPVPAVRWQEELHRPGIYDLEVDTSTLTPGQCAEAILHRIDSGVPKALRQLASTG